jgi:hypothetical protein
MREKVLRWSASAIITYFIESPKGTIKMNTADKNSWLRNTSNTITIGKMEHKVIFKPIDNSMYEASLK